MPMPASRVLDMHVCPMTTGPVPHVGGPCVMPFVMVLIGKMPSARATAMMTCVGPPDTIVKGSTTVLVGKMPQARIMDSGAHGGMLTVGCPTCIVGG